MHCCKIFNYMFVKSIWIVRIVQILKRKALQNKKGPYKLIVLQQSANANEINK